jgi:hypothetical protein
MDSIDQVERTLEDSLVTKLSVGRRNLLCTLGMSALWAAYAVYQVGAAVAPGMVRGRVFQDSWTLLFFGTTAIIVALTLNVRNWLNLGVLRCERRQSRAALSKQPDAPGMLPDSARATV